jgi:hypothetical protein
VWTTAGLTRYAVLFIIEIATRRVEIAGIVAEPDGAWVTQCGRQVTDPIDGCLRGKRFLLHDRDPLFTEAFRDTLVASGVETVRLPPRSPNLNAYAERFVRTIKESCLNRLILFGEQSLHRAIDEFVTHYHYERNHQGRDNQLLVFDASVRRHQGPIACRARLGGLLKYYHPLHRFGTRPNVFGLAHTAFVKVSRASGLAVAREHGGDALGVSGGFRSHASSQPSASTQVYCPVSKRCGASIWVVGHYGIEKPVK